MRIPVFITLLAIITPCLAGKTDDVIQSLGLTKSDLINVWYAGYCDLDGNISVNKKALKH